ncbi:MAG: hypothetical protein K1W33_07100 [Clostridia bacterium]
MEENQNVEEVNETGASEEVVETSQQTKTYSQEEVDKLIADNNENNQKAWNKRWGQEKSKMERQFEKERELSNLLQTQTNAKDIDELLDISYKQYGQERPNNSKDEEILGKNDAKEILELDDLESIESEANRLASKKRSAREEATFLELGNYLTAKKSEAKRKEEIKEAGIEETLLENAEFKEFMNKFNKDTSLKDIYDIYSKTTTNSKKEKPFSAGSLKGNASKEESEYFTQDEFMALTAKDLENPKIYEKAMKSRTMFK